MKTRQKTKNQIEDMRSVDAKEYKILGLNDWIEIDKIVGTPFLEDVGVWRGIDYNIAKRLVKEGHLITEVVHDHGMTVVKMIDLLKQLPELKAEAIKVSGSGKCQITLNAFHAHGHFMQPTVKAFFLAVIDYADDIIVSRDTLYAWFD